jgi:DNA (cytosine-5)-methyltransferase 1
VSKPRLLALCAGYGGLEMAVTALTGAEVAYVADSDKAASLVLAHHYPEVPNLGDISAYDWRQLIGRVDMVSAGFSCQDISNAGPRGGIGGSRSKVWKHVAEAVGVIRPRLVFLENVAAIRSRNRGLDVVAADLAEVGYDLWWTCLRASDAIGAAHHRDRWFGVARPSDTSGAGLEIRSIEPARDQLQAAQRSGAGSEDADGPARQERFCAAPGQAPRGGMAQPLTTKSPSFFPTPTAADGTGGPGTSPGRKGGMNLRTAVTRLPDGGATTSPP